MGKVFCLMGKSASGKDTIYNMVMKDIDQMRSIVLYTDRPMRVGEINGITYNFINKDTMDFYIRSDRCIESREYHTPNGIWRYVTIDDGIDLIQYNYLTITTLESYHNIKTYFGSDNVIPIYIYSNDGERLIRSIKREEKEQHPRYMEICERFLRDERDFSEDNLDRANIIHRVENKYADVASVFIISIIEDYIKQGELL